MTTTVRSVRVELEMGIASYIANAATVGRVTENMADRIKKSAIQANIGVRGLDTSLEGLGKSSTEAKIGQEQLGRGIDGVGQSTRRTESSIDKYSGRLKTLLDLVLVLGPAALRLGAGALPALTAGVAGLGALGGGIGVTALAVSGVGDALKALNDYELERTPENLAKVHQQFEKLGPDAEHFVRYLNDLDPVLESLQRAAAAGVLPGFEEGIDDALTRLPLLRQIVSGLADEVGRLSADTGEAIASERLTPFLEYIRDSGPDTLDAFARSTGNVALGLANMLVAFDPASRDFTTGLEDMTARFAKWSEQLEDDEGFQSFLDTVRDAGPELVELGGESVELFTGIVRSAAPLAKTTLPILTGIVNAFGAIANSPVGPALYTAATAWTVYSRAAKIAESTTEKIQGSWSEMTRGRKIAGAVGALALLGTSFTDLDEKAGLANTTMLASAGLMVGGPWGAAIGGAIGAVVDLTSANDDLEDSIQAANDALNSGDIDEARRKYDEVREQIDGLQEDLDSFKLGGDHDGGVFGGISDAWSGLGTLLSGGLDGPREELDALGDDLRDAGGDMEWFGLEAIAASARVKELSGALGELQGWLDKRAALRDYRDSLRDITKGLKDGFGREDVENIDAVGESMIRVANSIKDPALKQQFLSGALASLNTLSENVGPKAAAEIQKLMDKITELGLAEITPPKLTIDSSDAEKKTAMTRLALQDLNTVQARPRVGMDSGEADRKGNAVKQLMVELARAHADPTVTVKPGDSLSLLGRISALLGSLHDRSITVTVNQRGGVTSSAGGHSVPAPTADGGTVPKTGMPYADRHPYLLADGEEVVSNRNGQADRNRSLLKAINAGRLADGGTAGRDIYTSRRTAASNPGGGPFFQLGDAADHATRGLKGLEKAADKVKASYEKEKSKLDDLISQRSSAASSIASSALHDPFGNGLAGLDAQVEADTNDIAAMSTALATLVRNGLDPKSALYQQLAASMDVTTAQQLAELSAADLQSRAVRFQNRSDEAGALGGTVAGQQFNEAIRESTKESRELRKELRDLRHSIHELKDDLPGHVHDAVWDGARGGSEEGTRAGNGAQSGRVASQVRTQPRPRVRRGGNG